MPTRESTARVPDFSYDWNFDGIQAALLANNRAELTNIRIAINEANSLARYQLKVLERIDRRLAKEIKRK